ncbi:hypothetical protein CEUSTIGMA_g10789.t1 [Chlamydomonas eustigma]|uniref:SAM-dependent MTase RsmB/NOP-type domain-containing protein n=1 Tax=Chlamydomonas eustigma TaxID=1157962 RepID=A0A250XJW5_9CHLO|nr:hypothetical protein CEUSTIGMA_g10789.t1 [Chlamydomonas eustigma]|eukprot:GAX83364.1 hypothetical protein CEUSTIGMA_g10789.t1 [Chlamydomonas eustigma]
MAWHYNPVVSWDQKVEKYLSQALGHSEFTRITHALSRPSLKQSVRVNTLRSKVEDVASKLNSSISLTSPASSLHVHPQIPYILTLNGAGPRNVDYSPCNGREVVVNRMAGEAILRGAQVYCPGLLAASGGLAAGDLVGVSVALELPGSRWCGIPRGMVLDGEGKKRQKQQRSCHEDNGVGGQGRRPGLGAEVELPDRTHLFLGMGRCVQGRRAMFRNQNGLAVEMVDRVYDVPSLNGILPGEIIAQALPSILAAQVLAPLPGSRVLDMCAAPGGKTTMMAQLMQDRGEVIALDRTHAKVTEIRAYAASLGLTSIMAIKADATRAVKGWQSKDKTLSENPSDKPRQFGTPEEEMSSMNEDGGEAFEGFEPESFDHIMLDPPCSALGLRPRLSHTWTLDQLYRMADYQKALIHAAVALLKPGGTLVYSTCTINPAENEGNVKYILQRWGGRQSRSCEEEAALACKMKLIPAEPVLGGPGLSIAECASMNSQDMPWLTPYDADLVQRCDPSDRDGHDTIGFFIAKFKKEIL